MYSLKIKKGREGRVSPGGKDKSEQHEADLDGEYCRDTTKQKAGQQVKGQLQDVLKAKRCLH